MEWARWAGAIASFAAASALGGDAVGQLDILAFGLILSIAGLTAIESLFFGAAAAQASGYAPSAYQRQSGLNNLALTIAALLAFVLNWGPGADAALLSTLLIFLLLSGGNHLWSALAEGNMRPRSFLRPVASAAIALAALPMIAAALPG